MNNCFFGIFNDTVSTTMIIYNGITNDRTTTDQVWVVWPAEINQSIDAGRISNWPTVWYVMGYWMAILSLSLFPTALQPGLGLGLRQELLHPSRFRATIVQFLHPSFAASSFTPSSQCSLSLRLGRFPPGSLRRTLLDKSSSSWPMTRPAYLSLHSLQNFTMSLSPNNW